MLVGPAGGGKTKIYDCLSAALTEYSGKTVKQTRFNPKVRQTQPWTTNAWTHAFTYSLYAPMVLLSLRATH